MVPFTSVPLRTVNAKPEKHCVCSPDSRNYGSNDWGCARKLVTGINDCVANVNHMLILSVISLIHIIICICWFRSLHTAFDFIFIWMLLFVALCHRKLTLLSLDVIPGTPTSHRPQQQRQVQIMKPTVTEPLVAWSVLSISKNLKLSSMSR